MTRDQLSPSAIQKYVDLGLRIMDAGQKVIRAAMDGDLAVEDKSDGSVVSAADKGVEKLAREILAKEMPEAGVLGEEFGHTKPDAAFQWIIDPIDGTSDFVRGIPLFGSVLGLYLNQEPVAGFLDFPAVSERLWAGYRLGLHHPGGRAPDPLVAKSDKPVIAISAPQSILRSGFDFKPFEIIAKHYPDSRTYWTCYTQAASALGKLNASVELNLRLWDVAAAQILAEEGGKSFRWLRPPTPWPTGKCSLAMGDKKIVEHISSLLNGVQITA